MTLWREAGRGWRYSFRYRGQRHQSPRGFPTKREAKEAEDELRRVLRRAAAGLKTDGITFHSIRHTAATLLAAQGVPEGIRKQVMGHLAIATTQRYTHLQPTHEVAPLEQLSAALPIADLVAPKRRSQAESPRRSPRVVDFRSASKRTKHQ